MAVENYFTNNILGTRLESGANSHEVVRIVATVEVAAGDDDGSTYLLIKGLPNSFRPVRATLMCDAITGGTNFDLGLYDSRTGAVVSKGLFMADQTLASASKTLDGLAAVDIADLGAKKTLAELLSKTPSTALSAYDVVLTGDTVGAAAGTVTLILDGFAA